MENKIKSAGLMTSITITILACGVSMIQAQEIPTSGLELWLKADTGLVISSNRISQWNDMSGNRRNAIHAANTMTVPVRVDNAANGKLVLRFDGSNASFRFSRLTNVRTVFFVVGKNSGAFNSNNIRFVIGDSSTANFHPGTHLTDVLACHYTSTDILNGEVRFNGATVDPEVTNYTTQLGIVAMVTAGACTTSQVAADRWFTDRCWWGDMAEIILYSRSLSSAEVTAVEQYLGAKYGIALTGSSPVVQYPNASFSTTETNSESFHGLVNLLGGSIRGCGNRAVAAGFYIVNIDDEKAGRNYQRPVLSSSIR
jgi:hypothetical protein